MTARDDDHLIARMTGVAEVAAEKAVWKTLIAIGIDPADPIKAQADFAIMREVGELARNSEFRKDLEHTRKWRLAVESATSKGFLTIVATIAAGGVAVFWLGIKTVLGK